MEKKNKPETLLETTIRVLRNYTEYGSYKRRKSGALKAIEKKHPGVNPRRIENLFDLYEGVLKESIRCMPGYLRRDNIKESEMAEFEDIDHEALAEYLKSEFPGSGISGIKMIVSWTVFWHYLK